MENKIKAMIVDDSALIRNIVTKILLKSDKIDVVGTALNGRFALAKIDKLQPDVIILDLEMPEMNGIEFLKERARLKIKTPVIILSALAKKGAKITLEALSLGASDFILKPSEPGVNIDTLEKGLIDIVLALSKPNSYEKVDLKINHSEIGISGSKNQENIDDIEELPVQDESDAHKEVITPPTSLSNSIPIIKQDVPQPLQKISNIPDIHVVVIGISTGGPNALREILPLFPEDFPVPIVIVQHMPAGFTKEFADSLDRICALSVKEAGDEDIVKPGRILIAPGNYHIKFVKKKLATVIQLDSSDLMNGHRPSADILFKSAVEVYGQNVLGCVMTGMGKDGAQSIGEILRAGGITIAQDQASSIVFGMPKVAIEYNNIQLVRSLYDIPATIINIIVNKKIT